MQVQVPEAMLRNVPTQTRSRERLDRILWAADVVLERDGPSCLTAARVADTAGVPVGSIYHLFGDKDAIVDVLALSAWTGFAERVHEVADADEHEPLPDPIAAIFAALADGLRGARGFRVLWYSPLRTQRVRDATRPTRELFLAAIERILAVHWPGAGAEDRATAARMVVLTGDGLLREAFRVDPDGDEGILAETRRMLVAYLDDRLETR